MLDGVTEWALLRLDTPWIATTSALLVGWVALVYLAMAFGVRAGDLVFSGRHIGRLPTEQRWWSLLYGALLIGSAFVVVELADAIPIDPVPDMWQESAGFTVAALLGIGTLFSLVGGSRWERMLFVPITLLGSAVAIWLTFA